jgi:hypothetical protein
MAFPTLDAAAVPPDAPTTCKTIMFVLSWYELIRLEPSIISGDVGIGAGVVLKRGLNL